MYIYIRSMSDSQKEIHDDIRHVGDKISEHIIKLLLYPSAQEYHHWQREITTFLNRVSKLKGSNRYPKESFILNALQTRNDIIEEVIIDQVIAEEYELTPRNVSAKVIMDCVVEYQNWLAHELSTRGGIRPQDAYTKLDEIVESTL